MGLEVTLRDPLTGQGLTVTPEGTVGVVVHPHPPVDDHVFLRPYWQRLTDDGTPSGSSDMQVVGTLAVPLEFWVEASPDYDTYVKTVSVEIADANATLSQFGNVAALTNGCVFTWVTEDRGSVQIGGTMHSNWDWVRLALGFPAFGTTTSAFRASNVVSTSEAYVPIFDFTRIFGYEWGIRLRKGTRDRLVIAVRDTTTGVDAFDAVATGTQL